MSFLLVSKTLVDFLQIFVEGSWELTSNFADIKYLSMASCAGASRGMRSICPNIQTQWIARTISVEGCRWSVSAEDGGIRRI